MLLQWLNHPAPLTDIHRSPAHKLIPLLTPLSPAIIPRSILAGPLGTLLATATDCKVVTGRRTEVRAHPSQPRRSHQAGEHPANQHFWGKAQEKLPCSFLWIGMNSPFLSPQILRIPRLPSAAGFGVLWDMPRRKLRGCCRKGPSTNSTGSHLWPRRLLLPR